MGFVESLPAETTAAKIGSKPRNRMGAGGKQKKKNLQESGMEKVPEAGGGAEYSV